MRTATPTNLATQTRFQIHYFLSCAHDVMIYFRRDFLSRLSPLGVAMRAMKPIGSVGRRA